MQQNRRGHMASDAMSSTATPASSCTIGSLTWFQAMGSRNAWNNTYENTATSYVVDSGNPTSYNEQMKTHMFWENGGMMHHNAAADTKGYRELQTEMQTSSGIATTYDA